MIASLTLVILLLMVGAYWRNQLWNNHIEFLDDCVRKSPNKSRPYDNLSTAYFESGGNTINPIEVDSKGDQTQS